MLAEAGIRHALVGALVANAYRQLHARSKTSSFSSATRRSKRILAGVTMRVPVIEFDGIEIDQVRLTESLRPIENALDSAPRSEGVPIAPLDAIVVMQLIAGRTQDLADVEAIVSAGADREILIAAVERAAPDRVDKLRQLFGNVDRDR